MRLDLIFSIGPACRPAYHLKQHFLRFFSSPLDYQMGYSLSTVLHLFQTSFSDFFSETEEDLTKNGAHNNRRIIDTKNTIISLHHFDRDIPLSEAKDQFQSVMHKRFDTLHRAILDASTVGLICNRSETISELSSFLEAFGSLYPDQHFTLINIRNGPSASTVEKNEYLINHRLTILEYTGCDVYPPDDDYENFFWIGNPSLWHFVLKDLTLTNHPFVTQVSQWIDANKEILLYGAGLYCKKILTFLHLYQLSPYGIAVTDTTDNPDSLHAIPVKPVSAYKDLAHKCVVIITVVNPKIAAQIKHSLKNLGFDAVVTINDSLRLFY